MVKNIFILFVFLSSFYSVAQNDTLPFNPKLEIDFDGKRYRVYNNWLSVGAGAGYSTRWPKDQKNIGLDFNFHIQKNYFKLGAFMNGINYTAQNNINFHGAYVYRKEDNWFNLTASLGPSYSVFRRPLSDSARYNLNNVYNAFGAYACLEAVYKIKYDVGIGMQVFADYNEVQMVYGVRFIVYFSSAYRGIKYGKRTPPKKQSN